MFLCGNATLHASKRKEESSFLLTSHCSYFSPIHFTSRPHSVFLPLNDSSLFSLLSSTHCFYSNIFISFESSFYFHSTPLHSPLLANSTFSNEIPSTVCSWMHHPIRMASNLNLDSIRPTTTLETLSFLYSFIHHLISTIMLEPFPSRLVSS